VPEIVDASTKAMTTAITQSTTSLCLSIRGSPVDCSLRHRVPGGIATSGGKTATIGGNRTSGHLQRADPEQQRSPHYHQGTQFRFIAVTR
jgi:hypothetical protein